MEIDSMDQQKCALPWFHHPSKEVDSKCHIPTVVTNVRVPGVCCLNYLSNNNFAHDANLTVTVLHKALQVVAEKKGGQLPPVLYLQLDNCVRENKNSTMFGYLTWLVATGMVARVEVGFFMVGYVIKVKTIS